MRVSDSCAFGLIAIKPMVSSPLFGKRFELPFVLRGVGTCLFFQLPWLLISRKL